MVSGVLVVFVFSDGDSMFMSRVAKGAWHVQCLEILGLSWSESQSLA